MNVTIDQRELEAHGGVVRLVGYVPVAKANSSLPPADKAVMIRLRWVLTQTDFRAIVAAHINKRLEAEDDGLTKRELPVALQGELPDPIKAGTFGCSSTTASTYAHTAG